MLWDPALFVFLFYRSLAEREHELLRAQRRCLDRELAEQPTQSESRKPSNAAEARAQAIWNRRANSPCAHTSGTALAQVIKLPRR
jgi:hypothetical protein